MFCIDKNKLRKFFICQNFIFFKFLNKNKIEEIFSKQKRMTKFFIDKNKIEKKNCSF